MERKLRIKDKQVDSEKERVVGAEHEIKQLEDRVRELQDESLPEETAELFALAMAAKAGGKYGAALRLLNEGGVQAYYLLEELEEEEDDRRLNQVSAALETYTGMIMGQVSRAFTHSKLDEWHGVV